MKLDLTKSKIIILHLERAIERKKNIQKLTNIFNNFIIYPGKDALTYTDEERKQYLDLKYFHRLPSCKWRENILLGHIACSRG
jgi:hypothetical protein